MPDLAVIIPTFNERPNVLQISQAVHAALEGFDFEVIFVDDDSPDGTAQEVRELSSTEPRVRLVHRINRRGLSSAVIEGMMASNAPYLAVLDGDMQHDERILPKMFHALRASGADIVVGTRNCAGGSMGEFAPGRIALSQWGRRLSAYVCHATLSDPMSGFFMLRRSYLDEVVRELSGVGFKILIDLLASARRPVRVEEVGYQFRCRLHGETKFDVLIGLEYLELLLDKMVGGWIPVRYLFFGMVGAFGVLAQLLLMRGLFHWGGLSFDIAQLTSSVTVIALNYAANNRITYRKRRLRGWAWLSGLATFALACSLGLYLNLRVADGLFGVGVNWPLASLAGVLIASVWNYSITAILVWRVNRPRRAPVFPALTVGFDAPAPVASAAIPKATGTGAGGS